jgi:hypothetical protein
MDKKSKIFFIVFFLLIAGSIGASYYKFIVKRNYIVEAQADCDPYTKKCFVHVCDSSAGEECTGNPEEDTSYYKLIRRNAQNIPLCDPKEEGCNALACPSGETECEIIFCDPATAEKDGVECSDPNIYALEHPKGSNEEDTASDETGDGESAGDESGGNSLGSSGEIQVRDSLILLNEVNCGKGKTFVFADAANKIPVDEEGNYEAEFSSEEALIVSLANEKNQVCAEAVSLPSYGGKIYLDAKSTAETFVFQKEGIFTADPTEASDRLTMIRESEFFPALLEYVQNSLPKQNVSDFSKQTDFQNLVGQCAADVLSKLR